MALEDLTGTGKFVTHLNSAWPVDDDWVDEGDNHIRGIKNVLKNTLPAADGPIHLSSGYGRFPDGGASAPGISWINNTDSGFVNGGGSLFRSYVDGVSRWAWNDNSFILESGTKLTANGQALFSAGSALAPGISWLNATNSGWVSAGSNLFRSYVNGVARWAWNDSSFILETGVQLIVNHQALLSKGFAGGSGVWNLAPLRLDAPAGQVAGLSMFNTSGNIATVIDQDSVGTLRVATTAGGAPGGTGGNALLVQSTGNCYARSFQGLSLFASARGVAAPLTGALERVLRMRGVRFHNSETERDAIALDEVEAAYPEVVSEILTDGMSVPGKGIDYGALAAPLIEAIRELEARIKVLEAKLAGR